LDSVVNQTFKDIEILLINDGSTDGSDLKCLEWAKKDSRIVYVSKMNEGLGSTRNCGLRLARFDCVAFLDSDDWWDISFLEKMYASATEHDADMVCCDHFAVIEKEGVPQSSEHRKDPLMFCYAHDRKHGARSILRIISNAAWGKLYKKELFIKNCVFFPNTYCEDAAVMPYLISLCERISFVKEPLQFYLINRAGSILNTLSASKTMVDSLRYVRNLFAEKAKAKEYHNALKWHAYEHIHIVERLASALGRAQDEAPRREILEELYDFADACYPADVSACHIVGSYNLRRSVGFAAPTLEKNRCHYMNGSIISMFSPPVGEKVSHPNEFREFWLNADLEKSMIGAMNARNGDEYIFVDFLEERFDIAFCRGTYFTLSEAFEEVRDAFPLEYTRIGRFDPTVGALWKEKCDRFIDFLKREFAPSRIVLVKMYLSECLGEYEKEREFDDIENIRRTNALLSRYYDYFEQRMRGAHIVECAGFRTFFTDAAFPFGAFPHHLNVGFYSELGETLRNVVFGGDCERHVGTVNDSKAQNQNYEVTA
jgi:glycosyltransferase involved in cell wall biosynthesis